MKVCAVCKTKKPLDAFNAHYREKDGRDRQCRECKKLSSKRYRESNSGKEKLRNNKYVKYGLTQDQFTRLLEEQDSRCGICQQLFTVKRFPVLDHDHSCCPTRSLTNDRLTSFCGNCIRGLLCTSCNVALGMFGDNIERLLSAVKYLKFYSPKDYLSIQDSIEELNLIYSMD